MTAMPSSTGRSQNLRTFFRRSATTVGIVAVLVSIPGTAFAGSVEVLPDGSLSFVGFPGETNHVTMSYVTRQGPFLETETFVRVSDSGATLDARLDGGNALSWYGCQSVDAHTAECTNSNLFSTPITTAHVDLNDGDDSYVNADLWSFLTTGLGDDTIDALGALDAGAGSDRITARDASAYRSRFSAPTVSGGDGKDTITTTSNSGYQIACGGNRDVVFANLADILSSDCEVVTRSGS